MCSRFGETPVLATLKFYRGNVRGNPLKFTALSPDRFAPIWALPYEVVAAATRPTRWLPWAMSRLRIKGPVDLHPATLLPPAIYTKYFENSKAKLHGPYLGWVITANADGNSRLPYRG